MSTWLHAAVTLGALAAWITIVLVISGLWRPGFGQRWLARMGSRPSPDLAAPPTEGQARHDHPGV